MLNDVVDLLAQEKALPESNKDHALTGKYVEFRECHIKPDWLLIYRVEWNRRLLNSCSLEQVLTPISSISKSLLAGWLLLLFDKLSTHSYPVYYATLYLYENASNIGTKPASPYITGGKNRKERRSLLLVSFTKQDIREFCPSLSVISI